MGDLYDSILAGHWGLQPSHEISGYFAEFIYRFYGCFPEYAAVLIALAFRGIGIGIIEGMKIVAFLSMFVSGIFAYWLVRKISKSEIIGVIGAMLWTFFPYRISDFLIRAAFSEGVAIGFIPIVLYGVYRILADEEPRVAPYIMTIVGMACAILSHPFTALITGIGAAILIVFNIKNLIRIAKKPLSYAFLIPSLILLVFMIGFYFFPMWSDMNSGLYRIGDSYAMSTYGAHVAWSFCKTWERSGILRYDWLSCIELNLNWDAGRDTITQWTVELVLFSISIIGAILEERFLRENAKFGKWTTVIVLATIFVPSICIMARQEIFFALIAFAMVYLFIVYGKEKNEEGRVSLRSVCLNPTLYAGIFITILAVLYLSIASLWYSAPSLLTKCQFAFRLFALVGLGCLLFLPVLSSLAKGHKIAYLSLASLVAVLCVLNQAPVDKRIAYANQDTQYLSVTTSFVKSQTKVGWNNEYVPVIYYDDSYESSYANSLYPKVKSIIRATKGFPEEYIDPAFLEGSGQISLTNLNTPSAEFHVNIESESAKIQIPQFYYEGYQLIATSSSGESFAITVENVDVLISFTIPKGEYDLHLSYVGPTSYRVLRVFFYLSIPLTIGLGVGGYFLARRKRPDPKLEQGLQD